MELEKVIEKAKNYSLNEEEQKAYIAGYNWAREVVVEALKSNCDDYCAFLDSIEQFSYNH